MNRAKCYFRSYDYVTERGWHHYGGPVRYFKFLELKKCVKLVMTRLKFRQEQAKSSQEL